MRQRQFPVGTEQSGIESVKVARERQSLQAVLETRRIRFAIIVSASLLVRMDAVCFKFNHEQGCVLLSGDGLISPSADKSLSYVV